MATSGDHHKKFSKKKGAMPSGLQHHAAGPLAPRRKKRGVKAEFGMKKRRSK